MNKKSQITNVEWGLVIGVLLMIDLSQIVLDIIIIGFVLNPFIDVFVGMSFALYSVLRIQGGVTDFKTLRSILISIFGTFLIEMIPGASDLPLWCLDGFYAFSRYKKDQIKAILTPNITNKQEASTSSVQDEKIAA
ncbi:MAG: hypothetical protein AB201_00075 [Parcubacteria bacterium C7867-006]|nr:MAG: hypothetical protein AB201_00075 [Parcubacteria bacterium C7867-006]